jgi:hypothetical protein
MTNDLPSFKTALHQSGLRIVDYCKLTGRPRSTVEAWVYGTNPAPPEAFMILKDLSAKKG